MAAPRRALITGITGQDGSYLAELLLSKGYEVHGMVRRSSTENFERIRHLGDRVELHQADLLDQLSLVNLLRKAEPREVYNLAAQSFIPTSFVQPLYTGDATGLGVARMLEAIHLVDPAWACCTWSLNWPRRICFWTWAAGWSYGACPNSTMNSPSKFFSAR